MKKVLIIAALAASFGLCHVAYAQDDSAASVSAALDNFNTQMAKLKKDDPFFAAVTGMTVPDIAPAGDMAVSDLPKCSDDITTTYIKTALSNMPQPLTVQSVNNMQSNDTVTGREICTAVLITNAGVQRWDFEFYGQTRTVYVQGVPDSDQTDLDLN